ncbi:MAG: peptidoglycan D,D-transpeptidase FtsI family protein [Dongiaceae bacterium]
MTRFGARLRPVNPRHADPEPPRQEEIVQLDGNVKRAIDVGHARLLFGVSMFVVAFAVIAVRLIGVSLFSEGAEPRVAGVPAPAPAERGEILDRNGVVLATNLSTASLYANPQQIIDADEVSAKLAEVLPELTAAEIRAKIVNDKSFIWLRRNLTPRQQYAVNRLGFPGLYFQREERRVYPQGRLTAHVTGFTDIDNRGLAGIEQSFDDILREGRRAVTLSLDVRVQNILYEELSQAIADFTAIGGAGTVLDVRTGEVLAMVSLPDFDPNSPTAAPEEARFNRNTLGVYEMGSTFKILNTAMALDSGVVTLDDGFDARKPIQIGGFTISDFKPRNRYLTVPEIFMFSSNIGSAKMAAAAGTDLQRHFMASLGMFEPIALELPELGQPMYPADWKPINTMTIAYGHGIAVTPMHLARGVAAVVNDGMLRPLTMMKRDAASSVPSQRIISADTSHGMRQLLRLVVQAGTGRFADAPGYLVGGKTGTADKQNGRTYSGNARVASFIAAFPMNDPRYVALIMVDEPKPNAKSHGYATGGWVAAPAIGRLVQRMAPLVGLEPISDDAPEAQDELLVEASASE